jgi:hypothetical protein
METRKITVSNTKTQNTKVIETAATTLGELKEAFTQAGIDYTDMAFYEGLTRVELVDDASLLPHDVNYKGTVTNDLVIMLTNMKGKIASGMATRQEVYTYIQEHGLQQDAFAKFGKSYTNVSTAELVNWLSTNEDEEEKCTCSCREKLTIKIDSLEDAVNFAIAAIKGIASLLEQVIEADNAEKQAAVNKEEIKKSPYSTKELDEMKKWLENL